MAESVSASLLGIRADDGGAPRLALTRRASLNAVAALLDYGARLASGLLVTPILVRGLGPALFGSWEMLLRLGSYVSATDGRPTEALRLVVAQARERSDEGRRRLVGAAIAVWLLLVPIVAVLGGLLVLFAPTLVGADADPGAVRLAATCLVGSMLLGSLSAVPESVLRGLNLGHTRMGLQSALHLLGGLLAAGAVWTGLGIAGLGAATLFRAIVTGLCFWALVSRRVPWFGAARPARDEVRSLLGMSIWLTLGELLARVVLASDVIVLGTLLTPAVVTTYVLTGYAARVAVGVHVFTVGEAMPGMGALLGRDELVRATNARRELLTLTWLYALVAGSTVLLWNRTFLSLWIGPEHYAGPVVDLLIVLTAMQTAFIRLDAGIIDAALRPRQRVLVAGTAAVVTLVLAILLTAAWGMIGLCIGILVGRCVQSIAYPVLVRRALAPSREPATPRGAAGATLLSRPVLLSAACFAAAQLLGHRITLTGWGTLAAGVPLSAALVALFAIAFGVSGETRLALRRRVSLLARRGAR